jgi:hypothetical protein
MKHLWHIRLYNSVLSELYTYNFRIVAATVVLTSVYCGYGLEASKIFPMFALFNVVNESLLTLVSWGLKSIFEMQVSLKRIEVSVRDDYKGGVLSRLDRS